jgi:hypothetical protein
MTLREWANQHRGELHDEAPTQQAIADLLAVAEREIGDAESVRSDDGRLQHSFAACLAAANAALLACGFRLRQGAMAHHYLLLDSLQHTVGLAPAEAHELQRYRQKRSRAVYERTGVVTRTEAEAAGAAALRLQERLRSWLAAEHPSLVQTTDPNEFRPKK